jgi:hypothetical protein
MCYMKPLYCVCRIMSFKPNYVCLQLFVLLHAYVLSQRLMILHMSFFLFRDYSYSYHVIHMACTKVKSIMSRKKFILRSFLTICALAGLPVVPIGKPVIPTGILVFYFLISKFQFRPVLSVFVVTGHTGGNRFLRQYWFFNPWCQCM